MRRGPGYRLFALPKISASFRSVVLTALSANSTALRESRLVRAQLARPHDALPALPGLVERSRHEDRVAWQYTGPGSPPALHKEPLEFDYVHPAQRSYK